MNLETISYSNLVKILKELRNGKIGFDTNRDPRTNKKGLLIEFIKHHGTTTGGAPTEFDITMAVASVMNGPDAEAGQDEPAEAATDETFQKSDFKMSEAKPANKPTNQPDPAAMAQAIAAAIAGVMGNQNNIDEEAVRAIAKDEATKATAGITAPTIVTVHNKKTETKTDMGLQHHLFPKLVSLLQAGMNVWLTGGAGSGKTTAAQNAAKALGLPFYFNGAIDNEYKLLGFTDAQGRIVSRPFREAWCNGGVYLFDEVDASLAGALLAFNAALSNGHCDFPDGCIERHPDCLIIAAANTYGQGATNDYVGRNKLDGAFLDRFIPLAWDYDESLEVALSGNANWARKVQKYRAAAGKIGLRVIISPRASIFGAALLANGFDQDEVEVMAIKKGMTNEQWASLRSAAI